MSVEWKQKTKTEIKERRADASAQHRIFAQEETDEREPSSFT